MLQVAPPMLHIALGIFKMLFDALEDDLHIADVKILQLTATDHEEFGETIFQRYIHIYLSYQASINRIHFKQILQKLLLKNTKT